MIKAYYRLAKPGIIYGNSLAAIAGFLLASKGNVQWGLFIAMLVGLSLVIAAGCVFNNILDRELDAKMQRTKNRATVTGVISERNAFVYGVVLLFLGLLVLHYCTNMAAFVVSLIGFLVYVFWYTPLKPRSVHATLIGSIAGAIPPVAGYVAVMGAMDLAAWLLFFILVFWQMPHFYAIAIYRHDDYVAASVPVLPVHKGIRAAKLQIVAYIVLFILASLLLSLDKFTGLTYAAAMFVVGAKWLMLALEGFKTGNNIVWAKKVFRFSLIVLLVFCVMLSVNVYLP